MPPKRPMTWKDWGFTPKPKRPKIKYINTTATKRKIAYHKAMAAKHNSVARIFNSWGARNIKDFRKNPRGFMRSYGYYMKK